MNKMKYGTTRKWNSPLVLSVISACALTLAGAVVLCAITACVTGDLSLSLANFPLALLHASPVGVISSIFLIIAMKGAQPSSKTKEK